jgi:hypothetical protein
VWVYGLVSSSHTPWRCRLIVVQVCMAVVSFFLFFMSA